jgi:hypothetical protein
MIMLAFMSDPEVVGKILHHLGLPTTAPALAPARSSAVPSKGRRSFGFVLLEEDGASIREEGDTVDRVPVGGDSGQPEPIVRPPP